MSNDSSMIQRVIKCCVKVPYCFRLKVTSNDFYEWYSVGSAGKREEETAEEALFYSQNIVPLLERMTAASSSECYFFNVL